MTTVPKQPTPPKQPVPLLSKPHPVGRFFSMEKGRVGQFLSPRVLLVRKPFQNQVVERCYFGFDRLHQARKFTEYLAHTGRYFRLDKSQYMPQRYEIEIFNPGDVAKTLAYWDRLHNSDVETTPSSELTAA